MIKNKVILVGVLILVIFLALYSCDKKVAKSEVKAINTSLVCDSITFAKYIQPIIFKECTQACHNQSSQQGGVDLSTWQQLNAKADRTKIRINDAVNPMPRFNKMRQSRIDSIECWINSGAKNN